MGAALAWGKYTQSETVSGEIAVNSISITPSRPGLVGKLLVNEGDQVTAGAPLVSIKVEEIVSPGETGPRQVLSALDLQDSTLQLQQAAAASVTDSSREKLEVQALGQRAAVSAIDRQIGEQSSLIQNAVADLARVQTIADRGFISRRDMAAREDAVTLRRQQMAALEQARGDKLAELNATRKTVEEATNQRKVAQAQIAETRAALARQRYEVAASRGYTLVAPVSGRVTAVVVREGQQAIPSQPLMAVVPRGARLQSTLYVPTRAAGFLTIGQKVRLQVDAFPFATFGAVPATILAISPVTINHVGSDGKNEVVYIVTCSIRSSMVRAFGGFQLLHPGMTLKARVIIRQMSLLEWLFEPIYAVKKQ
ncbi:HlyD family secretion protein [Sphingomonas sp. PAMC 26605]|uniref:HlyD family secretion protein n=1 Tax=Sphingomonas sp. PAMC 26605 TaxID=1112214 RepID=UPI000569DC21|nr:HlyD family efflux transporter periplasmic adaptor subunit [Sphingomonas sp. PAMC 26605]